jgi:murein DD-endopeptidase MepM/ murein hydrolase activator NlpD
VRQTLSPGPAAPPAAPSNVRVLPDGAVQRLRQSTGADAPYNPYPVEAAPRRSNLGPRSVSRPVPAVNSRRPRSHLPAAGALLAAALPVALLTTVGISRPVHAEATAHRIVNGVDASVPSDLFEGPEQLRLVRPPPPQDHHYWVLPYPGVFTSAFGMRWGRLHAGIDLAGPWGSPIRAATDGAIEYAGPMPGYGNVMVIRDWDGTETAYGHMSSFVRRSGHVHAGEVIARIGSEGDATGPHLHFEVRINGVPVNPVPFLAKRDVYV